MSVLNAGLCKNSLRLDLSTATGHEEAIFGREMGTDGRSKYLTVDLLQPSWGSKPNPRQNLLFEWRSTTSQNKCYYNYYN